MSVILQEKIGLLGVDLTCERVRLWGIRGGLSVLDQGMASGSTFLLNLLLARWLTRDGFGAFAVAFTTLMFLAIYHSVLLLEPMAIMGPAKYTEKMIGYFLAQLKIHAIVVATLCGLLALTGGAMSALGVHRELATATVGSALALPFLLLLWLVRRMCYLVQQPSIAVWTSVTYVGLMLVGLVGLHAKQWLSPFSAFLWVGAASVVAVPWPLRQIGILRAGSGRACPVMPVVRESWNYGRWLAASTTLLSVASQTQTYLAAAMIGLGAAGALRAMQIPALVMTQVVAAVALLVLPTMSYDFGRGRTDRLRSKTVLSTLAMTALATAYFVLLWVFARPIEHLLYGGKFSAYAWLIPVLGLVPVCSGFSLGFAMALRAAQKPHFDLLANAVSAPVGLITALLFIKAWGLAGAAISVVAGFVASAGVLFLSSSKLMREMQRTPKSALA